MRTANETERKVGMTEERDRQRITWGVVSRAGWGEGPWDTEPDRIAWTDAETGYPCLMRRSAMSGVWCGYCAVRPGHPLHGRAYDDAETLGDITVHGGLTYANECYGDAETGICHRPAPGEPDEVWWVGFDTDHGCDYSPVRADLGRGDAHYSRYRDVAYVRGEVESLARQLKECEKREER